MPAKEQDVTISIKAKLYPDQNTIEKFKKLTTAYSEAATWLSGLMFNDFFKHRRPEMEIWRSETSFLRRKMVSAYFSNSKASGN